MYADSDLAALAASFAAKHGLPRKMARRLERMLAAQRDAVAQQQHAPGGAPATVAA